MGVSAFDPQAGKRSDVLREIQQTALSRSGCKCGSCGSSEYIPHKGRSICAYCRTPDPGASREVSPSAPDREWKWVMAEQAMNALSSMYGVEVIRPSK